MLRAVTSAVAEYGYPAVRIADVVDRARVSRQSFYAQFADKEQCFLAAHADGAQLILTRLGEWANDHADLDPRAQVRGGLRAYLDLASDESEFAYCMLVELQAIGVTGLRARLSVHDQIAALLSTWHQGVRKADPVCPEVPPSRYAAVVGAVHDLLFDVVARGRADLAPSLEDPAVDVTLTLLEMTPEATAHEGGPAGVQPRT